MKFDPKISLDKSWKFTPQVLILIILGIIVILGILILIWLKKEAPPPEVPSPKEETITEKQLKEIEELREKAGTKPSTEEKMKTQFEEIEKAHEKPPVLSEEEIQRQLEELNKLR